MKIRAQIGMVLNLDKCIGCHTCSVDQHHRPWRCHRFGGRAGLQDRGPYWANMFTNGTTINLGVKFGALGPGIIGSTGTRRADFSVAGWDAAVAATRSGSWLDQNAVLPGLAGGGISGLTVGVNGSGNNDTSVTAMLDGTQTASQVLYANSALIKAVGGPLSSPGSLDGTITFSSSFAFDFNPTDGITPGTMDFLGVAIHEMGHALGFVSGVDLLDYYSYANGPGRGTLGYDLNDTSTFSALDMFRYSAPGTLYLRTQSGFVGNPGDTFTILSCGGLTGQFSAVTWNGDRTLAAASTRLLLRTLQGR